MGCRTCVDKSESHFEDSRKDDCCDIHPSEALREAQEGLHFPRRSAGIKYQEAIGNLRRAKGEGAKKENSSSEAVGQTGRDYVCQLL